APRPARPAGPRPPGAGCRRASGSGDASRRAHRRRRGATGRRSSADPAMIERSTPQGGPMAILPRRRNVPRIRVGRLLDGTERAPVTDAALLVIDGTIAEVGPDAAVASPEGARRPVFPEH